jgi:hypothetical protein
MNMQSAPGPGGMFFEPPIWHPPISVAWIISILLMIGSVNVEALPTQVHSVLMHPAGFFMTFMIAIAAYDAGAIPATFAILFFLLMIWSYKQRKEEFALSGTVDWVNTNKRWFVESVLKEKPLGIKEKDVSTYPVQGDNSVPSSGGR